MMVKFHDQFHRAREFRRFRLPFTLFAIVLIFLLLVVYQKPHLLKDEALASDLSAHSPTQNAVKAVNAAIVVAKMRYEDISWLAPLVKEFGYKAHVYAMDPEDPEPEYLLPNTTRGHEAGAYLSYITEHYDDLADYTFFVHAGEVQWHNDASALTQTSIRSFRFEAVDALGYANLRCIQQPGCPDSLNPIDPKPVDAEYAYVREAFLPHIYAELLHVPLAEAPTQIGHMCCGQFVVSRNRIRQRPKRDYEQILHWVAYTTFTDNYGIGWSIEKLWHILFGMEAVYCPSAEQCRCDNYGWCGPLASGQMLKPVTKKGR